MSFSAEQRVLEIKRGLVLQVYLGQGMFWQGVRRARSIVKNDKDPALKPGVKVQVGLPPAQISPPYREHAAQRLESWRSAIRAAWEPAVRRRYWSAADWNKFTAACVLYDPPELQLAEFAEYGGLVSEGAGGFDGGRKSDRGGSAATLPIRWMDSAGHRVDALDQFYQGVLEELGKRYFEPRGEHVWQVFSDICNETDLVERLRTRTREIEASETHPYVEVGLASDDEISRAVRKIRTLTGKNSGGAPTTDEFKAIKCAALYDDHNAKDPKDGRRRTYTSLSLVEELKLDTAEGSRKVKKKDSEERVRRTQIGRRYLRKGRKLRKEREANRGTRT
ncbi:MAG: hypothetical protein CYG60_24555 [Actinobacteria bacterium]|nr:MAG: hypothetical protein CYG60_24555 [Actinomycetota bacterium]